MDSKSIIRAFDIALLAASAFLIIGILTFAGPCSHDDGTLSACFNSAEGIVGAGVFLVGIALFGLVDITPTVRTVLCVLGVILALFVMFAPGNLLPLCMMEAMHCRAVMQPFALVLGALIAILAAVQAVLAFRSR